MILKHFWNTIFVESLFLTSNFFQIKLLFLGRSISFRSFLRNGHRLRQSWVKSWKMFNFLHWGTSSCLRKLGPWVNPLICTFLIMLTQPTTIFSFSNHHFSNISLAFFAWKVQRIFEPLKIASLNLNLDSFKIFFFF